MIALLHTDGQLSISDIRKECKFDKWVPLLTYQINGSQIVLPVFPTDLIARDFAKRNLPKKWTHGSIDLSEEDIKIIKSKNWKIEEMNFPRKICEIPELSFDVEVHELQEEPDLVFQRI